MQTSIDRSSEGLVKLDNINVSDFADRNSLAQPICGVLQYSHREGDVTYYNVVGNGSLWVHMTDCGTRVEASVCYVCIVGNSINVRGCHEFECTACQ